ncbi:MAG: coenzyme F420-0:L-glutamate ligase [Candidatus Bathyarchaeota archaeon]|nr:MAG: coenzyme F420-0:L-glutamate ligase [Candidatus Bathyarchaeota archaeon]
MDSIQVTGIKSLPTIKAGDNLAELICRAADGQGIRFQNGDILVVTHVIVSRAEGYIVDLDKVTPSVFAKCIAEQYEKDPALVELVLRESKSIRRMGDGKLIAETKHGFVCANAGIDKSNVPGERNVALLPPNPDRSAREIRDGVRALTGCEVAVIISDTHGRPLRKGEMNVAIGIAGIQALRDRRGESDLFGYVLRVKETAVVDELASAAELVMGQASEGIPVALIRGYNFRKAAKAKISDLIRPREEDLFL